MKRIPSKANSSILRSMIALAVLIAGAAFLFSPPPTHADSVPLYSFSGSDGALPEAGLVQGSDGNFYGTTQIGGANGFGTVFKISSAGSLTTLHSFGYSDGAYPWAGLVQGNDGNFYGTTQNGGTNSFGTVFKITSGGSLTTLHSFGGGNDGENPRGGLVQASDGNFYGTTSGTVFRMTSSGSLTTLSTLVGSFAALVQGGDGDFYGTSYQGGTGKRGTVFKITSSGSLTTLYNFSGFDGDGPFGGLVQGSDGDFYGTTTDGGPTSGLGIVFKITSLGSLTILYNFRGSDGASPYAGLVQGSDGDFYGTTAGGGANFIGTVFKITSGGALTTLYSFNGSDGANPSARLVQGSDGNFYGTTAAGGANSYGTVFKITVATPMQNLITAIGDMGLPAGVANSLSAPLNNIDTNNNAAACGKLDAFIAQVNAKARNGQLTPAEASQLLQAANAIKISLGC